MRFYPDDEEFSFLLTEAWLKAGISTQAEESLEVFEERFDVSTMARFHLQKASLATLRQEIPSLRDASLKAIQSARAAHQLLFEAEASLQAASAERRLGGQQAARDHLARARQIYRSTNDPLGLARTQLGEARLAVASGELDRAETLYRAALTGYERLGTRRGQVMTTLALASLARRRGQSDQARQEYETALALAREVGFADGSYTALKGLAILNSIEGNLEAAERRFVDALAAARQSGNLGSEAAALNNLAIVVSDRGDLDQAGTYYQQALEGFRRIGHLDGIGSALNNLAILQWDRGQLSAAVASYRQCLETYEKLADRSSIALAAANLAEVEADMGDFESAALGLDRAIALQRELGEVMAAAKNQALRALLYVEEGQTDKALPIAREAVLILANHEAPDDEALARTVLSLALAASGSLTLGLQEIDQAQRLANRRENPAIGLWIAIEGSILTAQAGRTQEGMKALETLIHETRSIGIRRLEFKARLALAQLKSTQTDPPTPQSLRNLASEAGELGFAKIEEQATALLDP